MIAPAYEFVDVARAMAELLRPFVDADPDRIGTHTPADLETRLPYIRIVRAGGPTDRVNDFARLEIDVFHDTYAGGEPVARRIRDWLIAEPRRSSTVVFDRISCDSGPQELPWSLTVRRFGARYTVVSRRHITV